jgi:hypothetical protein
MTLERIASSVIKSLAAEFPKVAEKVTDISLQDSRLTITVVRKMPAEVKPVSIVCKLEREGGAA